MQFENISKKRLGSQGRAYPSQQILIARSCLLPSLLHWLKDFCPCYKVCKGWQFQCQYMYVSSLILLHSSACLLYLILCSGNTHFPPVWVPSAADTNPQIFQKQFQLHLGDLNCVSTSSTMYYNVYIHVYTYIIIIIVNGTWLCINPPSQQFYF